MNCSHISDHKYKIARLIQGSYRFSVLDFLESPESLQIRDAAYCIVGELLDKELIEDTGEYDISPEGSLVKIYQVIRQLDEEENYRIDSEKHSEFEEYIEKLESYRIQPDVQGKPRNLSFRVAEQKLIEIQKLPQDRVHERESLLISFHRYLGLAQFEETHRTSSDPHQALISEAYIRQLYAEYLVAKDAQQWSLAIYHLIKSAHLFRDNGLFDIQKVCESRSCEILIHQYKELIATSSEDSIGRMLDFAKETDNLVKELGDRCCSTVFQFVYSQLLEEIEQKIALLPRSSGELSQVASRGWTISKRYELPIISPIYELLDRARLLLINSGRSQDNRLKAKEHLEEAQSMLESKIEHIKPGNAKLVQSLLDRHLQALMLSLEFSDFSDLSLKQKLSRLSSLNFENILPFYWADTLRQVSSIVSELTPKLESSSIAEREIKERKHLPTSEPKNFDTEIEDEHFVGYTPNDFDVLCSAISNQGYHKKSNWFVEQSNKNDLILRLGDIPPTSENPSKVKSFPGGENISNLETLPEAALMSVGKQRKTSDWEQHSTKTIETFVEPRYVNESESDIIKLIPLRRSQKVLSSSGIIKEKSRGLSVSW
jgi:hypothetical protein